MTTSIDNTYECSVCHGVFEKTIPEAEAVVELNTLFPGFTPDDCDIVCDDCFKAFMEDFNEEATDGPGG